MLRPLDTVVPEQVIVVPKITLHDVIPQRTVLLLPQMAEQLEEPVPSDDFEPVGEEEEEQHPRVVPGSRVRDAHGRLWCWVVGLVEVYWWMIGTSTAQYTPRRGSPPGQGGIQILGIVVALVGDVHVTMRRQFPAVLRVLRASGPVPPAACRDWYAQCNTVQQTVEISQVQFFFGVDAPVVVQRQVHGWRNTWFDSGYIFFVNSRRLHGRILTFST